MEEARAEEALLHQAGVRSGSSTGDILQVLQARAVLQVPGDEDHQVHSAVPCAVEDNILHQVGLGIHILGNLPAEEDSYRAADHTLKMGDSQQGVHLDIQ